MNLNTSEQEVFDILLKDGEIIDPAQGLHFTGSVAVKNGRIAAVGKDVSGKAGKHWKRRKKKVMSAYHMVERVQAMGNRTHAQIQPIYG